MGSAAAYVDQVSVAQVLLDSITRCNFPIRDNLLVAHFPELGLARCEKHSDIVDTPFILAGAESNQGCHGQRIDVTRRFAGTARSYQVPTREEEAGVYRLN